MKPAMIFLDDGGVLNDNERRAAEWRRLVGEYLAPRLGGDPAAWGEANQIVFDAPWQRFEAWSEAHARDDHYVDFFTSRDERIRWLADMCQQVGVPVPRTEECYALSVATEQYVIPRIHAVFPDAVEAIRKLHAGDHALATASGGLSNDLSRYLEGMGVRECFAGRLYGPDLVQTHKASPLYYERILADTGIDPSDALFVDDNVRAVAWAAEAGARTVHMCRQGEPAPAADYVVSNLLELVDLLDEV